MTNQIGDHTKGLQANRNVEKLLSRYKDSKQVEQMNKDFAQFASDLDASTKQLLERGARLVEILKQGQYSPLTVSEQVVSIYAGVRGYLDKVAVNDVVRFETEVLNEVRSSHADLLNAVANEKELSKENDEKLKSILDNIVEKFTSN